MVKDILKKHGDKWVVPTNFKEIVTKVFQYKKGEINKNQDLIDKLLNGIHVTEYGARVCPKCSGKNLSGFFCAIF